MPINPRNISLSLPLLLLLLLFIAAGGSVRSGFGQDTARNITISDIVDLEANMTGRDQGAGEDADDDDSNFPQLNDIGSDNDNSSSGGDSSTISTSSSSLSLSPTLSSSSSLTTNQALLINEIELNPPGEYDEGKEWLELYNPTDVDINIGNFQISTASESATIKLPPDVIIEAGQTYVIDLKEQILSNTVDSLVLANAAGDILDRTPSLVDRSDDSHTWQRIPDGNNEWQFVENTEGNSNDDSDTSSTTPDSVENTEGNSNNDPDTLSTILDSVYSGSEVECLGSARCIEGIATRIADGDTLYVESNSSTTYKVDLSLIETPSRSEEMFAESTAFTRDLCLGSTVLVDEDDMLSASTSSDSDIVGMVYCSSTNLNSELLDNGYAEIKTEQCTT
ncbi:MAG: lamin tail domain-containing protein, partial [Thermoproteota archaeon]|nr:lamin tail domain-containing protein [Thermoproteota archaeon]